MKPTLIAKTSLWMLPALVSALLMQGCGGDSNSNGEAPPSVVNYRDLEAPEPAVEKLSYASSEELNQLLKNGVRMDAAYVRESQVEDQFEGAVNDAVRQPQPTPSPDDYSGTNVQVAGVDEGDYVKYDGEYLYLHTWPNWSEETPTPHGVRILETNPLLATAQEVSQIELPGDNYWGQVQHYLLAGESHADALVSVQNNGYFAFCGMGEIFPAYYYHDIGSTNIVIHDMADPANPQQSWQLELEGLLHHTRKIGDILYLVTSYLPQIDIPVESRVDGGIDLDLEAALDDLSVNDLLPGYRVNGGEKQLLNTSEECLVSANNTARHGYRSLHHIVAVNLREHRVADSVCLGTPVQGLYSSTDAIYLGASKSADSWENSFTVVHKFNLDGDTVKYAATGTVPGRLGWSNPAFRMDEYQGYLRVLTTSSNAETGIEHRLWVLQENSENQTLDLISMLPNEQHPDSIGKPGEDVYAVRFSGDKAYIVTFMRIDPLYVLDLSQPQEPVIAGELSLPGFSTYLHPLGDNYLFGFGHDADENGRVLGLKAALFDVSDQSNPTTVSEINLGSGWSDALYDYKALSFLKSGDSGMRITLPMTHVNDSLEGGVLDSYPNYSRVMLMLEVSGMGSDAAAMNLHGSLQVAEEVTESWNYFSALSRGIMHGDAVFYVDEPKVWGALWSMPTMLNGPY